jgi:hypothetical protein
LAKESESELMPYREIKSLSGHSKQAHYLTAAGGPALGIFAAYVVQNVALVFQHASVKSSSVTRNLHALRWQKCSVSVSSVAFASAYCPPAAIYIQRSHQSSHSRPA